MMTDRDDLKFKKSFTNFEKLGWILAILSLIFGLAFLTISISAVIVLFGQGKSRSVRKVVKQLFNGSLCFSTNSWNLVFFLGVPTVLFSIGAGALSLYLASYIFPELTSKILYGVFNQFFDVYFALSAVVLAPILEEFIFRGFLLGALTNKYSVKTGIILSSLLFGVLHADIIGATLFGVTMCLILIHTKSILFPIFLHFLNNLVAVIWWYLKYENITFSKVEIIGELQSQENLWIGGIFFILGLPSTIWFIRNRFPNQHIKFPLV